MTMMASLLSLLPPSCIVVPIRELVNTLFSTTTTAMEPSQIAELLSNIDINIKTDIVRGKSTSSSKNNFIKSSILSQASLMAYHERIEIMNNLLNEDIQDSIDSSQLSHTWNNRDVKKDKLVTIKTFRR